MNTLNQPSAPPAAAVVQRFFDLVTQWATAIADWRRRPSDDIAWDDGEPEPRR